MSKPPAAFPWEAVMKFGFGVLRLSPDQFWSMSLREMDMAMKAVLGEPSQAVSRGWLDQVMALHPDANSRPENNIKKQEETP